MNNIRGLKEDGCEESGWGAIGATWKVLLLLSMVLIITLEVSVSLLNTKVPVEREIVEINCSVCFDNVCLNAVVCRGNKSIHEKTTKASYNKAVGDLYDYLSQKDDEIIITTLSSNGCSTRGSICNYPRYSRTYHTWNVVDNYLSFYKLQYRSGDNHLKYSHWGCDYTEEKEHVDWCFENKVPLTDVEGTCNLFCFLKGYTTCSRYSKTYEKTDIIEYCVCDDTKITLNRDFIKEKIDINLECKPVSVPIYSLSIGGVVGDSLEGYYQSRSSNSLSGGGFMLGIGIMGIRGSGSGSSYGETHSEPKRILTYYFYMQDKPSDGIILKEVDALDVVLRETDDEEPRYIYEYEGYCKDRKPILVVPKNTIKKEFIIDIHETVQS